MPVMLGAIVKTGKKSNIPNKGIHFMAISDGRYYIYTAKLSQILIPGYYLRIYI